MRELEGAEDLLDVEEAALVLAEVEVVAALEVDLDEDEALVVLAEDGFEEAATAKDLLEDEIVGRRQVVEVVLGGGDLGRARNLVPHGPSRRNFALFGGFGLGFGLGFLSGSLSPLLLLFWAWIWGEEDDDDEHLGFGFWLSRFFLEFRNGVFLLLV